MTESQPRAPRSDEIATDPSNGRRIVSMMKAHKFKYFSKRVIVLTHVPEEICLKWRKYHGWPAKASAELRGIAYELTAESQQFNSTPWQLQRSLGSSSSPSAASSSSVFRPTERPCHAAPIPSRTTRIQSTSTKHITIPSAKRTLLQNPRGRGSRKPSQPLHAVPASVTASPANTNEQRREMTGAGARVTHTAAPASDPLAMP